ncbi:MAG TPA: DUF998 domain-containing protein [Bacteroidales bacterium]|nr:DUF998 domain-containing protein [Bacteroidales bacterium]HPS63738.1 DUF998 domain-containing protein [Bacteroidales bacterium]
MKRNFLLDCGIASSLVYVAMNIVIPFFYPGYDCASMTVSELSAVGAPTRWMWVIPGILWTALVTAFGWGVLQSAGPNRRLRVAGLLLFLYGMVSIIWPFAPMHTREVLASGGGTITDTLHLTMAGVSVLFMLASMGFGAFALDKQFRIYTLGSMLALLLFGLLTATDAPRVEANLPTPYAGLWERINIGAFLVWVAALAVMVKCRGEEQENN